MRTRHPQIVPHGSAANAFETLYRGSLPASRGGHLYRAFPYPTKIAPEAIALFIATHTRPGNTVFDGFAGSGTTGPIHAAHTRSHHQPQPEQGRRGLPAPGERGDRAVRARDAPVAEDRHGDVC